MKLIRPHKKDAKLTLSNVTWVPDLDVNLLSIYKLTEQGVSAHYVKGQLVLREKSGNILATGRQQDRQWMLNISSVGDHRIAVHELLEAPLVCS
jgi:hypothetical protein